MPTLEMLYVDCIFVLTKVLPNLKYIIWTSFHSENSSGREKEGNFT